MSDTVICPICGARSEVLSVRAGHPEEIIGCINCTCVQDLSDLSHLKDFARCPVCGKDTNFVFYHPWGDHEIVGCDFCMVDKPASDFPQYHPDHECQKEELS